LIRMTCLARIGILGVTLVAALVVGCNEQKAPLDAEKLSPEVESQLRSFFAAKHQQAVRLVQVDKAFYADWEDKPLLITKGLAPEVWPFFKAGENGDWQKMVKLSLQMASRSYQFDNPTNRLDERLSSTVWQTISETFRAFEELSAADPKYLLAYGRDIMKTIPQGSVFFAGTDAGRFLITFLSRSQPDGDPFFIISQNQLTDGLSLAYLRSMYANKIYIPTADDSQKAFQDYLADAKQRLEENRLKPGEDVKFVGSQIQVSGKVAVMGINGLLAKIIFDKNPNRTFFLDEQMPLDWTYAYLVPRGFVFQINRQPLVELSPKVVEQDRAFWVGWVSKTLGDWLTDSTSVKQICGFAEKTYVRKDLTGFTGDPQFVRTARNWKPIRDFLGASAVFSKSRTSIARVYWTRAQQAKTPRERERMLKEADFAFRQALALCPYQTDTVGNCVNFFFDQKRFADAVLVARTSGKFNIQNPQYQQWVQSVINAAADTDRSPPTAASPAKDSP
jgi:hypothetical protein